MLNFKTILFPVDFSDRCRAAAHYVRAMATRSGARIILLNVVENRTYPGDLDFGALVDPMYTGEPGAAAKNLLDSFLEREFDGLPVERRVEQGDASRTIVRFAQEQHVDLIMMPTHGYGGFRRFILGSVTAKVLHDAECAVWTGAHLEDTPDTGDGAIHRIVCAVDLTESKRSPLSAALEIATQHGAQLTISHAVPGSDAVTERLIDTEFRQHLIADAKASISTMLVGAGVEAGICVDAGDAHKVVNSCARTHKADLVVIGRPRHDGFGRLRTHSYAIIRESPCPVLSL
jgi:nucleotide-binding universal stress UspA family protein